MELNPLVIMIDWTRRVHAYADLHDLFQSHPDQICTLVKAAKPRDLSGKHERDIGIKRPFKVG